MWGGGDVHGTSPFLPFLNERLLPSYHFCIRSPDVPSSPLLESSSSVASLQQAIDMPPTPPPTHLRVVGGSGSLSSSYWLRALITYTAAGS